MRVAPRRPNRPRAACLGPHEGATSRLRGQIARNPRSPAGRTETSILERSFRTVCMTYAHTASPFHTEATRPCVRRQRARPSTRGSSPARACGVRTFTFSESEFVVRSDFALTGWLFTMDAPLNPTANTNTRDRRTALASQREAAEWGAMASGIRPKGAHGDSQAAHKFLRVRGGLRPASLDETGFAIRHPKIPCHSRERGNPGGHVARSITLSAPAIGPLLT